MSYHRVYSIAVAARQWVAWIEAWSTKMLADSLSPGSLKTRRSHLRTLAAVSACPPDKVTQDQIAAWLGREHLARDTRRSYRTTVRMFYAWAVDTGRITASPAAYLRPIPARDPLPHPVPDQRVRDALMNAPTRRERCMVRLAAEGGLRRAEVAAVHARDLIREGEYWTLVVHGKGERERLVPLTPALTRELRAQLEEVGGAWAFPSPRGGHLTPGRVGELLAELLPPGWTAHSLRHRAGTTWYRSFHDLAAVQDLLGHASPATTRRYVATDTQWTRQVVMAGAL